MHAAVADDSAPSALFSAERLQRIDGWWRGYRPEEPIDAMFGVDRPVAFAFAFHGYPALIHKLCYKRPCHDHLHVHGYREEGTTTPFDTVVRNGVDRFRLALAAVRHVPRLADRVAAQTRWYEAMLQQHRRYISEHGDDLPSIRDWRWPGQPGTGVG
ncbi:MAG: hypothetical protein QM674_23625 [Burkholderiaceae bacterium]